MAELQLALTFLLLLAMKQVGAEKKAKWSQQQSMYSPKKKQVTAAVEKKQQE